MLVEAPAVAVGKHDALWLLEVLDELVISAGLVRRPTATGAKTLLGGYPSTTGPDFGRGLVASPPSEQETDGDDHHAGGENPD